MIKCLKNIHLLIFWKWHNSHTPPPREFYFNLLRVEWLKRFDFRVVCSPIRALVYANICPRNISSVQGHQWPNKRVGEKQNWSGRNENDLIPRMEQFWENFHKIGNENENGKRFSLFTRWSPSVVGQCFRFQNEIIEKIQLVLVILRPCGIVCCGTGFKNESLKSILGF